MNAPDLLRRRIDGTFPVDPWGLDADLVEVADRFADLRWSIEVTGVDAIPADGPAVLVGNRRVGVSEPLVLARAVRRATGRSPRFLGVPDIVPLAPVLRRLGGALDHPAEQAALLRAGNLVVVPLAHELRSRHRAGRLGTESLAPALEQRAPVVPVAVLGNELGRRWRVVVGEAVELPAGSGPLARAELAEAARAGVQDLLDEAYPPRWLLH